MIQKYRKQFNAEYSEEKYNKVKDELALRAGTEAQFRISESPIFLTKDLKNKLDQACNSIISQIKNMSAAELDLAVPAHCRVPNDYHKPHFLAIDFGICKNQTTGEIEPQLIELQAFPTLYAFQEEYEEVISEIFPFLKELRTSLPKDQYIQYLKEVIVADEKPENVVLMEIYPERQKTNIDFAFTEKYLGIETVCFTKVKKQGKKLFYEKKGKLIPIHRIYNRVIFDELDRIPNLKLEFDFREEVDVTWVTHPNWFFKISKFILPKLEHPYIPKSYFLSEFPTDEKLENFVLKPLFSFAGSGVNLDPTRADIDEIEDKENFIMQRKVFYEPLFEDPNGEFSKSEIRMLYLWKEDEEDPLLMDNLARMTKVAMANVDFNKKDAIWIGSSLAFFEK